MAIFTFINAWWISIFFVLPFAIERDPGHEGAAPSRINWRRIMIATTLLGLFFTAALALIIKTGIVPVT